MATRIKKKQLFNISLERAQEAASIIATTKNKLALVEAEMNKRINAIKDKYQDQITELNEALEEPTDVLNVFANEQKESWGKKKSYELLHCIIGFRTGTPKVVKDRKFTWDGITDIVAKAFPHLVRTKTELDKETIIAMRDEEGFREIKDTCYIDVVQEETFFIEPKREEVPALI